MGLPDFHSWPHNCHYAHCAFLSDFVAVTAADHEEFA